jgi:hypothetical protein
MLFLCKVSPARASMMLNGLGVGTTRVSSNQAAETMRV